MNAQQGLPSGKIGRLGQRKLPRIGLGIATTVRRFASSGLAKDKLPFSMVILLSRICAYQRPGWTDRLAKCPDRGHSKALSEPLDVGPKPNTQNGEQVPRKGGESRPGKETVPNSSTGDLARRLDGGLRDNGRFRHWITPEKSMMAHAKSLSDARTLGSNLR
jgi:hypothetical protein